MNPRSRRITSVLALFLVFCISQVYIGVSFAAPEAAAVGEPPASQMQDPAGILTTAGNKPVTVNDASSVTGTTILSGATIKTPDEVGATVSLGTRGTLEMEQNSKVILNFQVDGINVMLLEGCVTLRANKGTTGEIETSKGSVGKTDPKTGGVLRVCHEDSVRVAAAAAATGGWGILAILGIIGGPAAVAIPVIVPGNNPSNSNPT